MRIASRPRFFGKPSNAQAYYRRAQITMLLTNSNVSALGEMQQLSTETLPPNNPGEEIAAPSPAATPETTCTTPYQCYEFNPSQWSNSFKKDPSRLRALKHLENHIHLRPNLLGDYRNTLITNGIDKKGFCEWSEIHGFNRDEAIAYHRYYTGEEYVMTMVENAKLLKDPEFKKKLEALQPQNKPDPDFIFSLACECGWEWSSPWNPKIEDTNYKKKIGVQHQSSQTIKPTLMRYQLQSAADLMNKPPMKWLIRDVLPATGLAALYGPPGSGKSFLLLDMCIALARGTPWFGHFVQAPTPVVYVILEGQNGFGQRLKAWSAEYGAPIPEQLRFLMQPFNLRERTDVDDLCKAVLSYGGQDGVIVIDTLSRATLGTDENSAIDMGELIAACAQIQQKTNGMVVVVHHTGKTEGKGLRGHSSLNGAVDCAIETLRASDYREWTLTKSRDSADGLRNCFKLKLVEIEPDESGHVLTSYVVEPMDGPALMPKKKLPAPLQAIKPILEELSKTTGSGPVKFGELCKIAKAKHETQGRKFRKDNVRRAYAKYCNTDPPTDDALVSF